MTQSSVEADQLAQSLRILTQRWAAAKATWRDRGADAFERTYIEPLSAETQRAGAILAGLASLLQRAEKSVP